MMKFPDYQQTLTIPTGATTGARIVINGITGFIDVYNSANQLVDTIGGSAGDITVGVSGKPQVVLAPTSLFAAINFPTGDSAEVQPANIASSVTGAGPSRFGVLTSTSPDFNGLDTSRIQLNGKSVDGTVSSAISFVCTDSSIDNFPLFLTPTTAVVDAIFSASSRAFGSVTIVPTAANTPTSFAVTGLGLLGTQFYGQATAETAVPGTQVTGVGVNGLSSNGMTVWLTRTNTTSTVVFWTMEGQ